MEYLQVCDCLLTFVPTSSGQIYFQTFNFRKKMKKSILILVWFWYDIGGAKTFHILCQHTTMYCIISWIFALLSHSSISKFPAHYFVLFELFRLQNVDGTIIDSTSICSNIGLFRLCICFFISRLTVQWNPIHRVCDFCSHDFNRSVTHHPVRKSIGSMRIPSSQTLRGPK